MTSSKLKRYICLVLALSILLLSGCGQTGTPGEDEYVRGEIPGEDLSVGYAVDKIFSLNSHAADGFNPYTATEQDNWLVGSLVYENVFDVDDDFNFKSRVVTEYYPNTGENAGAYWTFKVDTTVKMHDGSTLTGADVAYSIQRAITSQRFQGHFGNVGGVSAPAEDTFAISLTYPNMFLPMLLTVPIIKYGSIGEEKPAGSGPYIFAEDGQSLVAFEGYPDWENLPVDMIGLREYDKIEDVISAYEDSHIDLVTNDPSYTTNIGYGGTNEVRYYTANNMHFFGFNVDNDDVFLKSYTYRYALQFAVDRVFAANTLLNGAAVASTIPINPKSPLYNESIAAGVKYDMDLCRAAFENAGVEDYDDDGKLEYPVTGIPMEIDIDLIVCSDGAAKADVVKKFAEDLKAIGVTVTVRELSWDAYRYALNTGDFDMFYGEVRLTADFNLLRFVIETGSLNFGGIDDPSYEQYIKQYLGAADADRQRCCDIMLEYIMMTAPIIPVLFEKKQVITHRSVITGMRTSQYNILLDFPSWEINYDREGEKQQ